MKKEINYIPSGVDRSKQFAVLLMKSGIKRFVYEGKGYTGAPTLKQASSYILLENRGWHMVFDVTKTDEYINLTRYYVQGSTYSLKGFKECIEKGEPLLTLKGIGDSYNSPASLKRLEQWLNIRLYPNNTIAAIATFVDPDTKAKRTFQFNLQKLPSANWVVWQELIMKLLNISRTEEEQNYFERYYSRSEISFRDLVLKEVQYEDDIVPEQVNKGSAKALYGFLVSSGMEATLLMPGKLSNGELANYVYESNRFPKEWKKFFPQLKGSRWETACKMASDDFNDHRLGCAARISEEFLYPSILFANVGISDSYLNRKKEKKQTLDEIWNEYFDPELPLSCTSIKRRGDKIVLSINVDRSNAWYKNKYLFILDTKARTRKALGRLGDGEVHQLMLTANTVSDFSYAHFHYAKTLIITDGFDVLFKGTTLGWLFDAAMKDVLPNKTEANEAYMSWSSEWDSYDRAYVYTGTSILEWIEHPTTTNEDWSKVLIEILMKERQVMEQLAKCGLWNIFSNCLHDSDWIVDEKSAAARDGNGCLVMGKGKALTTSLGLTMAQLKMIDSKVGPTGPQGKSSKPCRHINLCSAMHVLNLKLKDLKALDLKTFGQIVDLSLTEPDNYSSSRNSIMGTLSSRWSAEHIRTAIKSIDSPMRRINFIAKYFDPSQSNSVETYNDYLRMRAELHNYLKHLNETEELKTFDTSWPIFPEAGTVFFRYVPNTRVTANSWDPDGGTFVSTPKQFQSYLLSHYKIQSVNFINGDHGELVGAVLKLSACERVQYLHDELSVWAATKKSENTRKGFRKAVEQMRPMEYISEKYGLRIIAPTEPTDLQREGRILQHCVGGYVESVALGVEKILFIRRNDMPSEPYFTMDVANDGTIRQIHSYRNLHPTPESIAEAYRLSGNPVYAESKDIIGFLTEWAQKTKGVRASSISKHYGCLGAMRYQ